MKYISGLVFLLPFLLITVIGCANGDSSVSTVIAEHADKIKVDGKEYVLWAIEAESMLIVNLFAKHENCQSCFIARLRAVDNDTRNAKTFENGIIVLLEGHTEWSCAIILDGEIPPLKICDAATQLYGNNMLQKALEHLEYLKASPK